MEPESSSLCPQVTAIHPYPEPTHFFCGCVIPPLETLPPGLLTVSTKELIFGDF